MSISPRGGRTLLATAAAICLTGASPAGAAIPRLLIVANGAAPASERIARRYARARRIPSDRIVTVSVRDTVEIDRITFEDRIQAPLIQAWAAFPEAGRPLYIVLTQGIPLRIRGTQGTEGDEASVDSELAMIPLAAEGIAYPLEGRLPNPYFRRRGAGRFVPFAEARLPLCLVTRLDGYTEDDALALIARSKAAVNPPSKAVFLFDLREGQEDGGQIWLRQAARAVRDAGRDGIAESTAVFVTKAYNVLGYASWGSNDPRYVRAMHFQWVPGALAETFVSTSARTFREPPPAWRPGRWDQKERFFEGSPQSLIADLIRDGVTGVSGYVSEPYLDACVRPDILFAAYLEGRNLAESYYLAMPFVSWKTVVVGDPLCAPFHR